MRHESGTTRAQERVASKIDERKAGALWARHMLTPDRLRNTITTADALYTQVKQAEQILAGGGHYLMAVKRNQPFLYQAIEDAFAVLPPINQEEAAFWQPQTHMTYDKQHGRLEKRILESTTALNDYLEWPGAAQVLRRTCQRTHIKTGKTTMHVRYAITSLRRLKINSIMCAMSPAAKTTAKSTPAMLPSLGRLAQCHFSLLRFEGWPSPPTAFRHFTANLQHALHLLGAFAT